MNLEGINKLQRVKYKTCLVTVGAMKDIASEGAWGGVLWISSERGFSTMFFRLQE